MGGRERSDALLLTLSGAGEGQEQLASLAPSSGASRHLLPLRGRRAVLSALIRRFAPLSPASQEKGCLAGPHPSHCAPSIAYSRDYLGRQPLDEAGGRVRQVGWGSASSPLGASSGGADPKRS